jgi:hypothetical protein
MRQIAEEMLAEFLQSEEFKERSNMSEEEIGEIDLSTEANEPLVNALRVLAREFAKERDNSTKIVKSLNMEINRMASKEAN